MRSDFDLTSGLWIVQNDDDMQHTCDNAISEYALGQKQVWHVDGVWLRQKKIKVKINQKRKKSKSFLNKKSIKKKRKIEKKVKYIFKLQKVKQ